MVTIKDFMNNRIGIVCKTKEEYRIVIEKIKTIKGITILAEQNDWNRYKEDTFLAIASNQLKYGSKKICVAFESDRKFFDFKDTGFYKPIKKSNVR